MAVIKQALISVSDKTGVVEFARGLAGFGVTLISTGGTAKLLRDAGLKVTEVADHTGFPEMLDGRVKTLHPKVHGGILARRDVPGHMAALGEGGHPDHRPGGRQSLSLRQTVARPGCTLAEAIENIDIGGPAMVRSAAKNYEHVAVVTDPADYGPVLKEMASAAGALGAETRFRLAQKAFSHTAHYDGAISNYLTSLDSIGGARPFSATAQPAVRTGTVACATARIRTRKPRSTAICNRRRAVSAPIASCRARNCPTTTSPMPMRRGSASRASAEPACVIVKHANPCGAAVAANLAEAYRKAFATDPTSAFGGIIAFNRELDGPTAQAVTQQFVEVVIAPGLAPEAARLLAAKANIRVLEVPLAPGANDYDFKRVGGGLLVQTPDSASLDAAGLKGVTRAKPSAGADRGPPVRLARGQVREVQRHRVLRRRARRWAWVRDK